MFAVVKESQRPRAEMEREVIVTRSNDAYVPMANVNRIAEHAAQHKDDSLRLCVCIDMGNAVWLASTTRTG